jgi:hypothetical protein
MFGEPLTESPMSFYEGGTRLYSDLEVDLLIDDLTAAALEAIDQAAGEAAKAAVLSMVEREAEALREAALLQAEVDRWRLEAETQAQAVRDTRRAGMKNTVIAALVGILGGLAVGIGIQNLHP